VQLSDPQPYKGLKLKTTIYHGYHIAGNDHLAIAINVSNPEDVHWFTPQTMEKDDIEQDAYTRAKVWAYEPYE
jgi:hypothetical protein